MIGDDNESFGQSFIISFTWSKSLKTNFSWIYPPYPRHEETCGDDDGEDIDCDNDHDADDDYLVIGRHPRARDSCSSLMSHSTWFYVL